MGTGVRITLMPSARMTSSKAWLNFVSRSSRNLWGANSVCAPRNQRFRRRTLISARDTVQTSRLARSGLEGISSSTGAVVIPRPLRPLGPALGQSSWRELATKPRPHTHQLAASGDAVVYVESRDLPP